MVLRNMLKKLLGHKPEKYYRPKIYSKHESHHEFERWGLYNQKVNIRFGFLEPITRGGIEFNSVKSIERCKDKLGMKRIFRFHRIPSPKFWPTPRFPCVRKRREHSGGKSVRLVSIDSSMPEIRDNYYYEEFVFCDTEFRAHVMDGKIFHLDKKVLKENYRDNWIKSNRRGYRYLPAKLSNLPPGADRAIIRAVKCLRLVFGAADVGINTKTGEYWIYEVNSAPGMRTRTRRAYQKAIKNYLIKKHGLKWK